MRDFGGMLSFTLQNDSIENAMTVLAGTHVFALAESLGGVESLVEHRHTIEGDQGNIPENLIRLSVGIEHVDDLIADFEQALT